MVKNVERNLDLSELMWTITTLDKRKLGLVSKHLEFCKLVVIKKTLIMCA